MQESKNYKEMVFLYDWMRIARRPNQTLRADIKMLFQLICIPISDSQIKVIENSIDPEHQKAELSKEDLIKCFLVEEECKKPKQKQLIKAFKYICQDEDDIPYDVLKKYFIEEDIDVSTTDMILKQLAQYENTKGNFDFKKFAATLY